MRTRTQRSALAPLTGALLAALVVAAAPRPTSAQTPFAPYYGKNLIHYDTFDWHTYKTEHFEIYYYPEIEKHLERIAAYAESAYQKVSADLKHDLAFKVPLILFKTHSEFEQQNVIPGAAQEGVGAFAEPYRQRMVLPIDDPPDRLYGLIVHELTHQFQFDIIPQSLIRRNMPLWVNEGHADYERGEWTPIDLMFVRDAAVADIVPKMSEMEGYGNSGNPRLVYNLGHALFEFIESRWGKEGVRQFLFSLRKSVIGGGEDAYEEAFNLKPDEFDQQFERYLKDRFKPFRDKERPADYGRNLAPPKEKSKYVTVLSIEPSPSGDLMAVVAGNRKDQEFDVILMSTKDGQVIKNLTNGFDKDWGFDHIVLLGERWIAAPWLSWAPKGDRIAYLVRTEKERTLILQNALTKKIEQRINLKTIDEPESPSFSPDGKTVAVAGLRGAIGDIFLVDLQTGKVDNVTNDEFADFAPTFSPDGKFLVYLARVSGNQKLFRVDLETKKKTQLTFGTQDEGGAKFLDNDTLVFPSTAVPPSQTIDAEVARNGNIYNLWTLNLTNGELRQYTDAVGGVFSPVALAQANGQPKIAFVSYYKGEYGIHTLDRKEPIATAASSDFGAPGPIIDFQAPLQHTIVAANKRKKGTFEKLFLDGRPPVNVGVTSGGDVFGGSQITFSDVLGDQQFNLFAASIAQYRTLSFSYVNLARRFQWATQAFSQTLFYYGQLENLFYDPLYSSVIDRDLAVATRTVRGGTLFGIYPLNRYQRLEFSGGFVQYNEHFADAGLEAYSRAYQQQQFGRVLLNSGSLIPLGVAFTQETTVFREFGPLAGNTVRLAYDFSPKIGNSLSRQTVDLDARRYLRIGASGLLALRVKGFKSWGNNPDFFYFGGNSEMRGYQYLEFIGDHGFFANAELRFPLIEAMLTPIGVLGGIRGVFFSNISGASFSDLPFKFASSKTEVVPTIIGYRENPLAPGTGIPVFGPNAVISGFRLVDGRASYGIGLETFALGFPIHFDWAWKTLFNKSWEDVLFAGAGGSGAFRKPKFSVWIGYDF